MAEIGATIKKGSVIVETGNKILFLVAGTKRGGANLAYELSQIVSLSEKKVDVVIIDDSIVSHEDFKYEKFIQDDVDGEINSAFATTQRCSSAFDINIEIFEKPITSEDDVINLIKGRMGYFPVIISTCNSLKMKMIFNNTIERISDAVCITSDNDGVSGKVMMVYKKNGYYMTPKYFEEFPGELDEPEHNHHSRSKKTNFRTSRNLFLYTDNILLGKEISTYVTKFNTMTKQTISKFIGGDFNRLKQTPDDATGVTVEIGNKTVFVIKIGTGGTGASLAYEIAHKLSVSSVKSVLKFIDGDIVEYKNLNRQRFIASDIGRYKAECTAERCIGAYNIDIEVSNEYITSPSDIYNMIREVPNCLPIILGCSDSLKLRHLICETIREIPSVPDMPKDIVYIDAGNNMDSGQVIFTYMKDGEYITPDLFTEFPQALEQLATAKLVTQMSCGELMNSAPQTKGANYSAANEMYDYFEDIIDGNKILTYVTNFGTKNKQASSKFITTKKKD